MSRFYEKAVVAGSVIAATGLAGHAIMSNYFGLKVWFSGAVAYNDVGLDRNVLIPGSRICISPEAAKGEGSFTCEQIIKVGQSTPKNVSMTFFSPALDDAGSPSIKKTEIKMVRDDGLLCTHLEEFEILSKIHHPKGDMQCADTPDGRAWSSRLIEKFKQAELRRLSRHGLTFADYCLEFQAAAFSSGADFYVLEYKDRKRASKQQAKMASGTDVLDFRLSQ